MRHEGCSTYPLEPPDSPGSIDASLQIVKGGTRTSTQSTSSNYCTSSADRSKLQTYDRKDGHASIAPVRPQLQQDHVKEKENCAQKVGPGRGKDFPFLWTFCHHLPPYLPAMSGTCPIVRGCKSSWIASRAKMPGSPGTLTPSPPA